MMLSVHHATQENHRPLKEAHPMCALIARLGSIPKRQVPTNVNSVLRAHLMSIDRLLARFAKEANTKNMAMCWLQSVW